MLLFHSCGTGVGVVGQLGLRAVLPRVAAGSILPIWAARNRSSGAMLLSSAVPAEGRTASPRLDRTSHRRQLDGPAQFRWGRRRCRAVPARSVTPLQLRRREVEGRQTGGPPRRQARPSGPPAGGVHAGCSRAPVTIRGEIRWTRSASATMRVTRAGKASGVALVCQGARRDGGAAREAGPRVGKRPGEGVPSMLELTLRAGLQPWTQKPPTRDRAEARSLRP